MTALRMIPPMTLGEFFAWDGGEHRGKLELFEGWVRAQDPASATHSVIHTNIAAAIYGHLRASRSRCRVGTEAPVVPPMRPNKNARVPDIAVTCVPPSTSNVFDDPIHIVDVLSPSNEDETWESINALASFCRSRKYRSYNRPASKHMFIHAMLRALGRAIL